MNYRGMVSSDWNECLAPTGPFDPISFTYPDLKNELDTIFKSYTSNRIPLSKAVSKIMEILPEPFTVEQMDAYLDRSFAIYNGVYEMIEALNSKNILFMINTTGAQGFFQRSIMKKLIPPVPLVASNPFIKFSGVESDRRFSHRVLETSDKGANTSRVMREYDLEPSRVILVGDSGGDGPHFQWGASIGAYLIGSMTKTSLTGFCMGNRITINKQFGIVYTEGQERDIEQENRYDFEELGKFIVEKLS